MKKIKKYRGLILSLVLAMAAVLAVHQYILALENQYETDGPPVDEKEKVEVFALTSDLATGTKLTEENLEKKTVYIEDMHPLAITEKEKALGEVITQDMLEDEVILRDKLLSEDLANRFSHSIPENKRAISLAVDEVSGVSGFIQAGDRIDVLVTILDDQGEKKGRVTNTDKILEDLKVLAAGEKVLYSDQELVQEVSTVTIAVTPSEGKHLADADEEGRVRLLLRPLTKED